MINKSKRLQQQSGKDDKGALWATAWLHQCLELKEGIETFQLNYKRLDFLLLLLSPIATTKMKQIAFSCFSPTLADKFPPINPSYILEPTLQDTLRVVYCKPYNLIGGLMCVINISEICLQTRQWTSFSSSSFCFVTIHGSLTSWWRKLQFFAVKM